MATDTTLLDGDRELHVPATPHGDTLVVSVDDLDRATGWTLRPEGLCRENVCVPVRDRAALLTDDGIDLRAFGAALGRPVAIEPAAGVAVFGAAPTEVQARLNALEAPPFTLPDLDGNLVSLDDYAGRKRLLIAWASW
ncbi:MAG TPA: hypothetical protein VGU73_09540 [Acidimicrobiia bacterium]|nr:hypothetical protein [Acidimicrobiia bacterium]